VRDLVDTYPNLASENADITVDEPLPGVLGNEALLTQCFSNLLGNAVKFVSPGVRPRIRVRAERVPHENPGSSSNDGRFARVWVEDQGIGIDKESQPRLFQMFQRLTKEYEGTGVGLAIVRKVVERMHGRIGVESERGKGSRFWVELQLPPEAA